VTGEAIPIPSRFRWFRRAVRVTARIALVAAWIALTLWAALALALADLRTPQPRYVLAGVYVIGVIAAIRLVRPRRYRWVVPPVLFLVVLVWFLCLAPSNDRDWAPDVARLAYADVDGSHVTLHNVRDFRYRSETDFVARWEDRSYDLDRLRTVDFMLVYWGSKAIAHAMVSFGFDDGRCLAISIETRKERGESYSAVQGFFRQYELIYVFADERDVVRLRTNYRHEDVYLYRGHATPAHARAVLLSYLATANELRRRPEWYNALTTNCATDVLPHARAGGGKGQLSLDILLSGHAARQAYRNGAIDTRLPFDQLEARSRVNDAALAVTDDDDPAFSDKIRAGLPVPAWQSVSPHVSTRGTP
jgi:hypothetical protein